MINNGGEGGNDLPSMSVLSHVYCTKPIVQTAQLTHYDAEVPNVSHWHLHMDETLIVASAAIEQPIDSSQ